RTRRPCAVDLALDGVSFLELESGFARGVGEGRDATRVPVAATVEDDLADARRLGPGPQQGAALGGDGALVALAAPDRGVQTGGRDERVALAVVDHLRGDVPQRAGDHQAGTGFGA